MTSNTNVAVRTSWQPGLTPRKRNDRRRRCRCGECRQCLDNARWERIFNEKFADPSYYSRQNLRTSSPLSSV